MIKFTLKSFNITGDVASYVYRGPDHLTQSTRSKVHITLWVIKKVHTYMVKSTSSWIIHIINQLQSWNQLLYLSQNLEAIWQPRNTLCANEISWDLRLICVLEGYPISQQSPDIIKLQKYSSKSRNPLNRGHRFLSTGKWISSQKICFFGVCNATFHIIHM